MPTKAQLLEENHALRAKLETTVHMDAALNVASPSILSGLNEASPIATYTPSRFDRLIRFVHVVTWLLLPIAQVAALIAATFAAIAVALSPVRIFLAI